MTYGITATGFNKKRFEDLQSEMQAALRDELGDDTITSPDSVYGQIIDIVSEKLAEQWEVAEAVYSSQDPDEAEDTSLEAICAYTGTERDAATPSTVTCTVNVDPGTYAAGTLIAHVTGNEDARFVNSEAVVNDGVSADDIDAVFESEETGPIEANAGTLTVIASAVVGWNSVTNAEDATPGEDIETDASLRTKRVDELSAQGSTRVDAIRADILRLDGVISATVLENDTDEEDDNGLPPHSIECIVYGPVSPTAEDDQTLVDQIWASKAGGIQAFGENNKTVTDAQGFDHTIGFTRPGYYDVYVEVVLYYDTATYASDAEVQDALALVGSPNETYRWSFEMSKVYAVDGVVAVFSFGVSETPGGPYTETFLVSGLRDVLRVQAANVSVTSNAIP